MYAYTACGVNVRNGWLIEWTAHRRGLATVTRTSANCGRCLASTTTTTLVTRNTSTLRCTARPTNVSVTYLNPPPVGRTSGLLCPVRRLVEAAECGKTTESRKAKLVSSNDSVVSLLTTATVTDDTCALPQHVLSLHCKPI